MEDIIFVTAYKDINRGNWNYFRRTNQMYIDYFYNLAYNIKYKLVVYVEEDILKIITTNHFLNDNVIFKDLNTVDTFLKKHIERESEVMNSDLYKSRLHPVRKETCPENKYPEYNLINHSKVNFMKKTKDLFPNYKYYGWIDFGVVNSNIELIPRNLDLSILKEKIYCHTYLPLPEDRFDEIEMLQSYDIYILGSGYIAHHSLVETFENLWEQKILDWQNKYISDDDQSLLLQLCYDHKDIIEVIHYDVWFGLYPYLFKDKTILEKIHYNVEIEKLKSTPLCEIMGKNKSNKGHQNIYMSWHNYTPVYYENLLKRYKQTDYLRIFELGLGGTNTIIPNPLQGMPGGWSTDGKVGASLYGWSEFFVNSDIYGADIDIDKLINTKQITTFQCDQRVPYEIHKLWSHADLREPFDIMIQNGSSHFNDIVVFFENSIHKLAKNGFYVVEDILNEELHLFQEIISKQWDEKYPDFTFLLFVLPSLFNKKNNNMLVVFG